ncbi:MAG: AraC family transcriptional regulator [Chitinophagaceae bacterium]|nr:MAG: AraC family transcriptional regulator [Chitinophagaceae bacterium]
MPNFTYHTIDPPIELAHYVRCFWFFEGKNLDGAPYVYRSMADASAEMVFHYKARWQGISEMNEELAGTDKLAILQSPTGTYNRFITREDFGIFGVYLYPYAITELFRLSSSELQNQMPSISDCLGNDGRILQEKMLLAKNNQERVATLSLFLIKRCRAYAEPASPIQACVKHIIHSSVQAPISKTAALFCISARQLERQFKTITGFAPKPFSRISRFQQALHHYGSGFKSLTEIAYDCGYYDQSHFIHDFKKFSGYEPRRYFSGKAEGIEYRQD